MKEGRALGQGGQVTWAGWGKGAGQAGHLAMVETEAGHLGRADRSSGLDLERGR